MITNTNIPVAKMCIDNVNSQFPLVLFDIVIEPSAGNESFIKNIEHNNKIGIDISPECDNVIKMDFFEYSPENRSNNILVIS